MTKPHLVWSGGR